MKKARAIRLLIIAALCVALSLVIFVACDKPDDGPDKTPEVTYSEIKGDKAFDAAYAGATKLAEKSAATLAANEYTAGIRVELGLRGENYVLKLDANVDGATAGDNEIAAELYKGDSLRLGVYVFNRMLYVYDGEKYRFLDMFSTADAPTVGVDLAGAIGKLGGIVKEYTAGALTERMEALYKDNLYIQLVRTLLTGYGGTLSSEGYYAMELPLGQLAVSVIPLLDMFNIDLGFELSSLSGLMKTLIGVSYEELTAEDFDPDAVADKLARVKLGFALNEAGELNELTINYALNESAVDIGLKELVLAEGRRDILPAELEQAAAGGIRISGESWLNGQKIYSDITLKIDTKSSKGIDMVFKAGSSKGANDYIYAVYSGERVVPVRVYTGETEFNDGNPNKLAGAFSARVSPKFMQIISPIDFSTIEGGVPGLKFYAAIDLGEALTFIKNVIGGANPISENSAQAVAETAQTSTVNIQGILSAILPGLGIGGDEVSVTIGMSMIKNIMKAIQGESYDPEADLGATVTNLINTLATALNVPAVMEPDKANPNQAAYDPEYRLKYLLENLLGENVTRNLSVNDFLNAMGLKLGLGLNTDGAFGLKLSAELWTTYDDGAPETPDTVSAVRSTFEIGFCDAPTVPARDVRFTVNYRPISTGYTAEIEGGIPDIEGEQYESIFFDMGSGQEPVSTDATLIQLVMYLPGMLGTYGIFG